MADTLTVTSSDDQQTYAAPSPVSLQPTRSSQALGVPEDQPTNANTPDPAVLSFLSSEAAGTVHDESPSIKSDHHKIQAVGFGIVIMLFLVAAVVVYRRTFQRRHSISL